MRLLKEAGCDLGQADDGGETPAHYAAFFGFEGCLRLLKETGCDLGQADSRGRTPAHRAAVKGY